MKRLFNLSLLAIITVIGLSACGQKGDLIKPPKRADIVDVN